MDRARRSTVDFSLTTFMRRTPTTNLAKPSGGPYVAAELRSDGPAAMGTEAVNRRMARRTSVFSLVTSRASNQRMATGASDVVGKHIDVGRDANFQANALVVSGIAVVTALVIGARAGDNKADLAI
eukprot:2713316-Prymnesium_polylepis.1